ncbi:MAG: sucrase ferredoxin, partial [Chloroflexota bacterium]
MIEYCSDSSRAANEPLAGTAPQHDAFFLLEYREAWSPKVAKPGNNTLSAEVAAYVSEAAKASTRNVRVNFIRQQGRTDGPLTAFVASVTGREPTLYRLSFESYDDLLERPLQEVFDGAVKVEDRVDAPHYFVCTHKERDRACGRDGWPVYTAFREQVGDATWQTTHLGGHRFAATLLALPSGAMYGHVTVDDIQQIVTAHGRHDETYPIGGVYPLKLRGHVSHTPEVQAAL